MIVLHIYRTTIILNQIFETIITIQKLRFWFDAKSLTQSFNNKKNRGFSQTPGSEIRFVPLPLDKGISQSPVTGLPETPPRGGASDFHLQFLIAE